MRRYAWLRRIPMALTLVLSAVALAWLAQALLAQEPQERRFRPLQRRPFRNAAPKKDEEKEKADGEKPADDGAENEKEPQEPSGNSLSIVDKSANGGQKKSGEEKGEPAHDREPLFEGWENPKVVLLFSGNQMGYIEPCGCTGLENQKGGLTRRITFLSELREKKGWEVLPLDVGQHSSEVRSDRQQELKLQMTASGFSKMGYGAVGLGPSDLSLSTSELSGIVVNIPVVSANVSVYEREAGLVPAVRVVEAGGMKIGVTQIVSDRALKKVLASDIEKRPAAAALKATLEELKAKKCDLLVLLAYATQEEAKELASAFPAFDVIAYGDQHGEPERELRQVTKPGSKKSTYLTGVGYKGMYVSAVGLFDDAKAPIKYQRVPLDGRFADSEEGLRLLADYQKSLESAGLEGLGVTPRPYPDGRKFVGSQKCGECHTRAFAHWQKTPHAQATETIVNPKERAGISRHHDPECLSCHTTGWNPQGYYPYQSGYVDLKKSAHLHANGCENCHGAGSKHAEAEGSGASEKVVAELRESMRLPLAGAKKKCLECHDLDNSPEFQKEGAFEKYWEEIKHPWRD